MLRIFAIFLDVCCVYGLRAKHSFPHLKINTWSHFHSGACFSSVSGKTLNAEFGAENHAFVERGQHFNLSTCNSILQLQKSIRCSSAFSAKLYAVCPDWSLC